MRVLKKMSFDALLENVSNEEKRTFLVVVVVTLQLPQGLVAVIMLMV